jgi:hypothetical protein
MDTTGHFEVIASPAQDQAFTMVKDGPASKIASRCRRLVGRKLERVQ